MAELIWLPVTAAAYGIALRLPRRPLLNPTLIAMAALVATLVVTGVPYAAYADGTGVLTALLGPAVVALAVPLHRERETLRRHAGTIAAGAAVGASCAIAVGLAAAALMHLAHAWELALTSRSATAPISIALAGQLHGAAALSAVLSVLAGVAGATLGPRWLDLVRVRHPLARGLAHGVASHGIGTARMLDETRLAGATAAVGMALGGAMVAFALPLIY
jgi:putative effector of murein hydrolase